MKIGFLGFQKWGLVTLRSLLETKHTVALVLTHPDSPDPYGTAFPDSVANFARASGVACVVANSINVEARQALLDASPDVILSSNWRRKLPMDIVESAARGAYNVHRSLLPSYAGLAPINWAIANGESTLGVTIHRIDSQMDLGPIAGQRSYRVEAEENATDAFERSSSIARDLVHELLSSLDRGDLRLVEQDPKGLVYYHRRGERELRIRWQWPVSKVHNLIRAQSDPFPNAYAELAGKRIGIGRARLPESKYRGTPGRLVDRTLDGVVALCGDDQAGNQGLVIQSLSVDGEMNINSNEFFNSLNQYFDV